MSTTTEHIWNEFHSQLFQFVKKRVKDNDTANDILQDIFIKIHLKLHTLASEDKLTGWIYQITRNSILDHFKKQKPQADLSPALSELSEEKTFNTELSNCLKPIINQLPENYKDAILQTELGQLSQKEYAEKLGISYSGAKSRVQRAKQQLHVLFNECCTIQSDKYGNIMEHICNKNCGCS